jgi:hypothetical protein
MALKKLKKRKDRKLYKPGGMYSSNTIPAALSTTNIVQEESDPQVLRAQEEKLTRDTTLLQEQASKVSDQIEQDKQFDDQKIEAAGANATAGLDAGVSGLTQIADKFIKPENRSKTSNPFASAVSAGRITKASNLAAKATTFNASTGVNAITNAKAASKAASLAQKAGGSVMSSAETGKTIVTNAAGNIVKQGSSIGAGLKSFATSGAGIGTIASLAGAGVSKLADDGDATTMKFGEGAGATLSGIGTGIGAAATTAMLAGSTLGPVGTLVGGTLGAIYGLGKGLVQRGKARREKRQIENKRKREINKFNTEQKSTLLTSQAGVRAAQLKSKTFSGYDLGRNTTAMLGGLRMGIPRYGN